MHIIEYMKEVNILLVVLDILFIIVSFLFFDKKGYNNRIKDLFVIGYTLINLFLFTYFNSMFQGVFTLKYLSVRGYLVIVLITLSILLYTVNKKIKLLYKLFNYLLSAIIVVILLVNIYIIISDKFKLYNIMAIDNSITLMNISFIIFFSYLCIISFIYIGYCIYDKYSKEGVEKVKVKNKKNVIKVKKYKDRKKIVIKKRKDKKVLDDTTSNKPNDLKELLNYNIGDNFYINGVDCSIIFCDSNKENIVRNYNILSSDINAKLVNGYTLDENIMIRDICKKLNVNNLGSVDISNFSILNMISVDEYNFLKRIFSEN